MILQIKRGNTIIAETADFSYSPALQEVRKITCEVESVFPLDFKAYNSKDESAYDTVIYNGNTFILYVSPSGDNNNEAGKYKYSLLFYGKEVLLQNIAFLDVVSNTGGGINQIRYTHGGLFQFWGDAQQLADRIKANIDTYNETITAGYKGIGTWTFTVDIDGEVAEDMIDVSDGTNLFDALKNFYDKFNLNYYFSTTSNGGNILVTDKERPDIDWTFKQGDGEGAIKISSSVDTSTPVITRIIPQGGSRNVPPEYKKDAKPIDLSRYCPYILLPNDASGNIRYYIDSSYGLKNYGVRGKTISTTFSGIYPSIRGKKLGDLYGSLPQWDTYASNGEPDIQSGKVAGAGVSLSTRIDKIIGSTPVKDEDSNSFFIYITSPGFNIGYKVSQEGEMSGIINDTFTPEFKNHDSFWKYKDSERFDIYGLRVYYDSPVNVRASFTGSLYFAITNVKDEVIGKKVKVNLRLDLNNVKGATSYVKEIIIGQEDHWDMLEIPFDDTVLAGWIAKETTTSAMIYLEITFDSDISENGCLISFAKSSLVCSMNFNNTNSIQDKYYFKYASVTDAVFSMRTGTYTGTEFKINKNGILPLYGEESIERGETMDDVAMFSKGARYKIACYRTDSDNVKLPLYTDGSSPAISENTEFVILNIVMPETYVTMAEKTLERASTDYLSRYDRENRTVSLDISSGFVAEHPNLFANFVEGNILRVRDDGIGVYDLSESNDAKVDMRLQIQSLEIKYSKDNLFPSYSCTIARRKILSFYERLAQENQSASTQNTTNVTLGGTGSGTNIFSEQLLNDLIASYQKFNGYFEWDEEKKALRCKSALYTNQWLSALGASSSGGGGGGGTGGSGIIKSVYGFADLGGLFENSNLTDTFNAYTINEIWKLAKEGFNSDKLWQELAKDDSTKKIDISHLPDNINGKFVTIDTEQTITAGKIFTGLLSTANIVPNVNNASTLGIESKRWENIYTVSVNTNTLQIGDIKIVYDSANKAVTFEHVDGTTAIGLYTRGWISALGVSHGGSGGGSGLINNVYGFTDLGTTFSDSDLTNTFNAYTVNEIWKLAKEGGGIKNISQSGSGNAVTGMTLSPDGKTITALFGETFARQQDFGTLNNTVVQISNKLDNFLEGSDTDNIINKWKELEAFLSGLTESDNLAKLLALKADKSISIIAGTGITGGGNLSANRTLSLAASGVTAGTYTKVTVDTYGRVTTGNNPTTLAGYGITDAVTINTAQTVTGAKTFTQHITLYKDKGLSYDGNVVFRSSDEGETVISSYKNNPIYFRPNGNLNTNKQVQINQSGNVDAPSITTSSITIGGIELVYDSTNKALRVKAKTEGDKIGLYSDGWLSALGISTNASGGGGAIQTVYSFSNLTDGTTFSDSDLTNTFNAYTVKKIYDMANQESLDTTAMWNELKKADSSKVIDASHIPTSVLDGRWVTQSTNQTITGQKTFTQQLKSTVATGTPPFAVNSTTIVENLNVSFLDGRRSNSFTSIIGRHSIGTSDTAPYNYIHLFRIANSAGYSTLRVDIDIKTRYHRALLFIDITTEQYPYGESGTSINISKLQVNSQGASLYYKVTKQASGYNYYDIYYNSGAWDTGSYDVILRGVNGGLVFEPKNTNMNNLPSGYTEVIKTPLDGDISGNATTATALKNSRTLWGQPFNGTANVSGNMTGVGSINMSGQLTSTVASGVAPFIVVSNTVVGNLNADMVDGLHLSDFDGRYVKKAGDTMTGDLTMGGGHMIYLAQASATSTQHIRLQGGRNDYGRIAFGATAENAGWMEIASCDDGNEPIYARQYTGVFTTVKNTLTLLDANGDTVMSNNKGLSVGWGSRQVREGGSWIHGGSDTASSTDANLRFGSWWGIGWYPTIDSTSGVRQGNNAMWLNVRTGVLDVHSNITSHNGYLAANWDSARRLVLGGGSTYAWIDSRNSSNNVLCNIVLQDNKVTIGNYAESSRFVSTVGTGTQPYQCNSTTLNTNLNADLLDNWHIADIPRNYNSTATYSLQFALGGTDNNWKKIFACSESGSGPYRSVTVWGRIWYSYGNHAQGEVRSYHFCAIFQMRSEPSASDSNVGDISNSARLYLPTFAKGMDNIRLVRVGTNNFELQVRQIGSYNNGYIQYQYWANGANVSAWRGLQSTSNTSVAVSARGASTLADSRASSADVLTTSRTLWGRPFNGSSNIDGNIDNAAVITSKGGIWLDLKGSSGVAFYAGGSLCAVMNTTGVGIGTSSPSQKLHVAGNIIATGAITAKASSSDIRLKTDIQGYDAMGIIRKFRSVKYHWNAIAKENSEVFNHDNWNYGLIAQDLLSGGYSQWVKDIFNDYYTIDYERLIPVVWKGLQEVDDEVTKLKREVARLNKRVKELEKSLCA